MKLKDDYILYNASEEETIAVATGDEAEKFNGLLRANKTAGAIMELLKEDISMDDLVAKMTEKFEATAEEIRDGVSEVLNILREVGAIDE
ncbi:MAG: PqqD family protein [Mogibacterium sp.]|nr:PqqD family protein [Mogibacterium sp.]